MFIQNKYFKWYYAIINNTNQRNLSTYIEKHHIIPKSLGGTNDIGNIASLTAREHFICHQLLTKITVGEAKYKMIHAAWRLANAHKKIINSRTYEKIRMERSNAMRGRKNPGVSQALTGRKVPQDVIEKRIKTVTGQKRPATSIALTGRKNPGVSQALTGRKQPEELVKKRAESLKGKPSGALGRKQTDEEKAKRSAIMKGKSGRKGIPWTESRRLAYKQSKLKKE